MEQKFMENLKEVLEIEDREIALEDEFRTYEEWDSLAYLSVIAMLDEEYGVEIETEDFKKLRTVGALLDEVKKRST
jgi:acyl carrier protein